MSVGTPACIIKSSNQSISAWCGCEWVPLPPPPMVFHHHARLLRFSADLVSHTQSRGGLRTSCPFTQNPKSRNTIRDFRLLLFLFFGRVRKQCETNGGRGSRSSVFTSRSLPKYVNHVVEIRHRKLSKGRGVHLEFCLALPELFNCTYSWGRG